jgi:hypothetical protein
MPLFLSCAVSCCPITPHMTQQHSTTQHTPRRSPPCMPVLLHHAGPCPCSWHSALPYRVPHQHRHLHHDAMHTGDRTTLTPGHCYTAMQKLPGLMQPNGPGTSPRTLAKSLLPSNDLPTLHERCYFPFISHPDLLSTSGWKIYCLNYIRCKNDSSAINLQAGVWHAGAPACKSIRLDLASLGPKSSLMSSKENTAAKNAKEMEMEKPLAFFLIS